MLLTAAFLAHAWETAASFRRFRRGLQRVRCSTIDIIWAMDYIGIIETGRPVQIRETPPAGC
jgi:hypothetical protein